MQLRWYGQSAFRVSGSRTVFVDPFPAELPGLAERGMRFDYPPIEGVEADLLLVTHEHADHNAVEVVGGVPAVLRSTAGTFPSPVGEVVGIASEHDAVAGTQRGPNTIARFALDGLVFCHLGDFGQPALRPEQREALGDGVDVLFVPVGDGPTIGGAPAADLVRSVAPRLVVPMHYRTDAVSFLEPPDAFLEALGADVRRLESSEVACEDVLGSREAPVVALLAPPLR